MEKLIELFLNSFDETRNKDILMVKDTMDMFDIVYKTLVVLEDNLGKTKPEKGRWTCVAPLSNVSCKLGKLILIGHENEDYDTKQRNIARFKVGYHFLRVVAEEADLLTFARSGETKRAEYRIVVQKDAEDTIEDLLSIVDKPEVEVPVYTRPQFQEPLPFIKFYNPEAGPLVRNIKPGVEKSFTLENCPKVFEVINKHMSIAWNVNQEVLSVYQQSQEDPIFTFENKMDLDEVQLEGLERERDKVLEIAEMVGDRRFWEYMFYDSRGRLYSSAVYLSHAASKLSKSLFLYNEKKPLGSEGWFWLLVHAANCFGEDKLPIEDRFKYADDKLDSWLEIAKDPVGNNKLWQEVDSPFEFLSSHHGD